MSANETAREFRIANSKRGPWDIVGYVTVEDCDKLIAEYHSSQMSGIAQRAAEKIVDEFGETIILGHPLNVAKVVRAASTNLLTRERIAAIISQEGSKP